MATPKKPNKDDQQKVSAGEKASPAKAAKKTGASSKPAPEAKAPIKKVEAKKAPAKKVSNTPAKTASKPIVKSKVPVRIAPPVKKVPEGIPADVQKVMDSRKDDQKWISFVGHQRQHLLDLRDNILDSMAGVTRETLRNHPEGSEASGSGEHQADAGSDAYDRDFALNMLSKEQNALFEVEDALRRIDNGTYGICEISHKPIPILRLEAIPFARLTVECQSQWEKEKGLAAKFVSRADFGFGGIQNDSEASVSLDEDEE